MGAYSGILSAAREPKFSWTGVIDDRNHDKIGAIAVAVGVLASLPILAIAGATMMQALTLTAFAHVIGAWAAVVFNYWNGHYFVIGAAVALGIGFLLLIPLVMIAMWRVDEIATVLFGRRPTRLLGREDTASDYAPKVSIHVPAYMEPPDMLKATLNAVARLDYRNFECVVVINNTPDPTFWRPVEERCRELGARFKFINAGKNRRLQGRGAAACADAYGARRRDHRRDRRRLYGVARLATQPRPHSPTRGSAWCRPRRIIATATRPRCIPP